MSPDFELLMTHLRARTAEVEVGVPSAQGSADESVATRLARARLVAIRRGDRVAHLYKLVDGVRPDANGQVRGPDLEIGVTENECRTLIAAGAKWVGPKEYFPEPRPHVEELRVRNFRCVKETDFPLSPLHALIGPNDSGKSTLLDAITKFSHGGHPDHTSEVTAYWSHHAITSSGHGLFVHRRDVTLAQARAGLHERDPHIHQTLHKIVSGVRLLRLDPDAMRKPTNLIAHGSALEYDPRGYGLAAVYDALLSRRTNVFLEISKRFATLFPTARSIQLTNPSQTTKALGIELSDGRSVGAEGLSEGMLYWLAFAALPYLQHTPIILIEEPENGLHPSRIGEVMRVLRNISNVSQIIVATHHPLVINELQADEVTIITRTAERGTIATPLSQTKNFAQRSKVYALGELWLNYADGDLESDLVPEAPVPESAPAG
jgi:ABC-type uncharacterized transport system ATPase subunit